MAWGRKCCNSDRVKGQPNTRFTCKCDQTKCPGCKCKGCKPCKQRHKKGSS